MTRLALEGGCHCGDHRYTLDWPDAGQSLPARRCGCSYCTRFNGTWTSHPQARLGFRRRGAPPRRYRFGTGTADFLSCRRCGVTFAAVDGEGSARVGIINVNTLDQHPGKQGGNGPAWELSNSDFDGEAVSDRRARRRQNWCGRVTGLEG